MNWLLQNWQTMVAMAIVALTVALFVRRLMGGRKSGCGEGCGCLEGNRKVPRGK